MASTSRSTRKFLPRWLFRAMESFRELRAEGVDGELVGGKSLLGPPSSSCLHTCLPWATALASELNSSAKPGVLQRRQVLRVGRAPVMSMQQSGPDHRRQHHEYGRRHTRTKPRRSDARLAPRRSVEIRRQQLAAVGIRRFGLPVAHPAGGTAGNVVAAFMTCGRIGSPSRLRGAVLERAAVRADVGLSDV